MTKFLHTDTLITFTNPYMVMIEHEGSDTEPDPREFQKLTRKVYELIRGTWGFSRPQSEYKFPERVNRPNPIHDLQIVYRSYWVFKEEIDALQFRLMIGEKAMRVYMWPQRRFTIHEVVETDES